ncbi:MAG: hypothetical protein RL376_1842 [Verrucomicrobiota bacterium]|jgi:hypothetical protein
MNLSEADQDFLRDLIKTARQRPHFVNWTDRDGTARTTTLTPADAARLNAAAQALGVSKDAALRQATFWPAKKATPAASAPSATP